MLKAQGEREKQLRAKKFACGKSASGDMKDDVCFMGWLGVGGHAGQMRAEKTWVTRHVRLVEAANSLLTTDSQNECQITCILVAT